MKRTLFRQMITYLLMFCIVLCAAGYAVIELLFGEYYVARQKETIQQSMDELVSRYNEGDIEDIDTAIDYYDSEYGITVHFYDTLNNTLYGVSLQGQGRQGVFAAMSEENIGEFFVSTSGQGTGRGQGTEWLSYLTQTDDGNLILGRISYASMDSAVAVVQQFLLWFGVAVAAAFILFAFFFSRSMSRPLKRLNAIAFEMGELNFSMRYDEKRRDEIGQLGSTLNALTTKLENTITQLKGELSKEKTLEKMRTQFTAQVSHELQTPLSVIKGYAEALADNIYETKEAAGVYSILVNEAQKISDMVSDLLDLSQMEAGAYVIKKQTFDLAALLRRIYERYSTLPNEKAFSIHLSAEDCCFIFRRSAAHRTGGQKRAH